MSKSERSKSIEEDARLLAALKGEDYEPYEPDKKLLTKIIIKPEETKEQKTLKAKYTSEGMNPYEAKLKRRLKEKGKESKKDEFFEELQKL